MPADLPDATIAPEFLYTWESQVNQYPHHGSPGLSYFEGKLPGLPSVDCLLWRNRKGLVIGILNHYPVDFPEEKAHNVNVWVHPRRQRRGIGRRLVEEALRRWPDIDPAHQRYTPAGRAWAERLLS